MHFLAPVNTYYMPVAQSQLLQIVSNTTKSLLRILQDITTESGCHKDRPLVPLELFQLPRNKIQNNEPYKAP